MSYFSSYFSEFQNKLTAVDNSTLEALSNKLIAVAKSGKKVIVVGNGGSAAMASHVTVDLTKNAKVRSVNFNEADLITCFANDFGYENWVKEAIAYYADPGDAVILISSSGKSPNIVNAATHAKKMGLYVATFSGFSKENPLCQLGDLNFWVDSNAYNIVEMVHHVWLLAIVDRIIELNR